MDVIGVSENVVSVNSMHLRLSRLVGLKLLKRRRKQAFIADIVTHVLFFLDGPLEGIVVEATIIVVENFFEASFSQDLHCVKLGQDTSAKSKFV